MNTLILVLALAQAGAEDIRKDIKLFTNPDTAADDRPAILERLTTAGAPAVWHVQAVADAAPSRVVAPLRRLGHQVKTRILEKAGDTRGAAAFDRLRSHSVDFNQESVLLERFLDHLRLLTSESLVVDPSEQEKLEALKVSGKLSGESLAFTLDQVLSAIGLDYDTPGGIVLIGRRAKLWPGGDRPVSELTPEQVRELGDLIAKLEAERIEDASAADPKILAMGTGAISHLEKAAKTGSIHLASRCKSLISRLKAGETAFSLSLASSAREQKLEGDDLDFFNRIRVNEVSLSFKEKSVAEILEGLTQVAKIKTVLDPALKDTLGKKTVTVAVSKAPIFSLLEVLIRPLGGDLKIEDGAVRVVARP